MCLPFGSLFPVYNFTLISCKCQDNTGGKLVFFMQNAPLLCQRGAENSFFAAVNAGLAQQVLDDLGPADQPAGGGHKGVAGGAPCGRAAVGASSISSCSGGRVCSSEKTTFTLPKRRLRHSRRMTLASGSTVVFSMSATRNAVGSSLLAAPMLHRIGTPSFCSNGSAAAWR